MKSTIQRCTWVAVMMLTLSGSLLAQSPGASKNSPPGGGGGPQNAGSSTLQGETYPLDEWPSRPPNYSHQRIIWYKVVAVKSKSQPLILEPLSCADKPRSPEASKLGAFAGCDSREAIGFPEVHFPSIPERDKNPLVDGEKLVIAIDDPGLQLKSQLHNVLLLNVNITTQVGSPINPAPLRPAISAAAPGPVSGARSPVSPGPTVALAATCKNPAAISAVPGTTPQRKPYPKAFDPLEVRVTDAGRPPKPLEGCPVEFTGLPRGDTIRATTDADGIAKVEDTVTVDKTTVPGVLTPPAPGHFQVTAKVTTPDVSLTAVFDLESFEKVYYLPWMNRLTGDTIPTVTITAILGPPTDKQGGGTNSAPEQQSAPPVPEGTPIPGGQGGGATPGSLATKPSVPPSDDKKCPCAVAVATALAKVFASAGGEQGDQASPDGLAATTPSVPSSDDKNCPCAVAVATALAKVFASAGKKQDDQAQEKSLTLLNASYAQVHNLYTYNIATGLVYSFLRNQTYSRVETAPPAGCTSAAVSSCVSPELYTTTTNPTSPTIAPALFFTAYVFGSSDAPRKWCFLGRFDAERKWAWSDLYPQPSVGFSLSSPSTDFFYGFSSEVLRGVQIVYGDHMGKVNYLAPTYTNDPTSSAAPITLTHFKQKFFFGVTFNITFIQTLFGGGKGGGG